jgi:hypothetical protein
MFPAVSYDDTFPHVDERANSLKRATAGSGCSLLAIAINGVIDAGIFGLPGTLYALVALCFAEVSSASAPQSHLKSCNSF